MPRFDVGFQLDKRARIAIVVGLLAAITALRLIAEEPGPLYLVPVLLGAYWFGPRAGVAVGVASALCYGVSREIDQTPELDALVLATLVRGGLYALAGWLVGVLADSRARLAGELHDAEQELAELRTIQEALAPAEPPERPALELATCYLPAEHGVSGDFFIVAPGLEGSTLIAVGDVAGRGLDAAKTSWYVRTLLASSAELSADPAAILERANHAFIEEAGFGSPFVTAACLRVMPEGEIEWALAGHDDPILLDEGGPLRGGTTGLPLGVADRIGAVAGSTKLTPGAGLLLYTDGLTEARRSLNGDPRKLELFGERRVSEVIVRLEGRPSADVVEGVRDEVQEFSGGKLADDLCLIALRARTDSDTTEVC
jgi:serine phosphatase RsbU (regulator of sigma subunit)